MKKSIIALAVICLIWLFMNPGAMLEFIHSDYEVELSSKSSFIRTNSEEFLVTYEGRGVFYGYITEVDIEGDLIFGYIKSNVSGLPSEVNSNRGYFIANIKNGTTEIGLKELDWLGKLRELGITREPRRKKPSYWWAVGIDRW